MKYLSCRSPNQHCTLSDVNRHGGEASVHEGEVHHLKKKKIWLLQGLTGPAALQTEKRHTLGSSAQPPLTSYSS
jgi:hypothetical protein